MWWALLFYARIDKMATEIYKINYVYTIDGEEIEIIPLKIKYMKELMNVFEALSVVKNEAQSLTILTECARIAMKQYCPKIATLEDIENNFDIHAIHQILEFSAGIKLSKVVEKENQQQPEPDAGKTWEDLDLAKLESEVFLLGMWKSYDELETSISIQELMAILTTTRELDYEEKKFLAALQGINLDEKANDGKVKGQKEWEDLKARVFSGGKTTDSRDILALQGINAQKAGFGIGMGLDYEDER